jgi:hypothetical protein
MLGVHNNSRYLCQSIGVFAALKEESPRGVTAQKRRGYQPEETPRCGKSAAAGDRSVIIIARPPSGSSSITCQC